MKDFIISINWYGPYSRYSLHEKALKGGYYAGIYLALDPIKNDQKMRYIGISTRDLPWRVKWDREPPDPLDGAEMWAGLIAYHNAPDLSHTGSYKKYGDTILEAETVLVYLLQPHRNIMKTKHIPKNHAVILNRWFDGEKTEVRRERPYSVIPDFIEYEPLSGATLAWHDDLPIVRRMSVAEVMALGKDRLDP